MEHCAQFLTGVRYYEFEICWVPAGTSGAQSLFGVPDYLASLALLLVIYTISDYRNRFRLELSPLPIYYLAFWIFVVVGLLKIISELWFHYSWPILSFLDNKSSIDAILLAPCLLSIFYWIFVSFVHPPIFSKLNCHKYFEAYRRVVHNGTEQELRIALQELSRSLKSIIQAAPAPPHNRGDWQPTELEATSNNFLLLMGNRRLCGEMAYSSPDTAALFFREIAAQNKTHLAFDTFAKNIAVSLLSNKSSPIFHEDSGWESGWSGYVQLYSSEIFGNPKIVSSLAGRNSSPLDIRYTVRSNWDAENWKAYTRVALLYISRVIDEAPQLLNDYSVNQIFSNCEYMMIDLRKLDGAEGNYHLSGEYQQLNILVRFIRDLMELLDKKEVPILSKLKPKDKFQKGIHERIAKLVFDLILHASYVRHPIWTCWVVQHNSVWGDIFHFADTQTERWVFRRLSRLMYDEVKDMNRFFNFKGATILGYCLNVLGLDETRRVNFRKEEAPVRLSVLSWIRKNYSRMRVESPKVAQACLHGSVTFDEAKNELVKTYSNETGNAPNEVRFRLD